MSKNKRLFLIAGYSAKNIVDASLVYMVQKLSKCGDVILVMDCDAPDSMPRRKNMVNMISVHIGVHTRTRGTQAFYQNMNLYI